MSKFIEVTQVYRYNTTVEFTMKMMLNIDKVLYIINNEVYFSNNALDYIVLDAESITKLKERCLK